MAQNIETKLNFRIQNRVDLTGTYEPETGDIRILGQETQRFAIDNGGGLSPEQRQAFAAELGSVTGADTQQMTDRVAEAAETQPPAEAPSDYTTLGRYTEASADAQLGEGFKGERVREVQQHLVDSGYELGEHGADSYWGPATQSAYDQYVTDGHEAIALGPVTNPEETSKVAKTEETTEAAGEKREAKADTDAEPVDAGRVARRFARASHRGANFDPASAAETLMGLDNESMAAVREELESSGRPIEARIDAMEGGFVGQFAIAGRDAHYVDLLRRVAAGERNEGEAAAATDERVDALEARLVEALPTRNHQAINAVFAEASNEQLAALDLRLRDDGVWDQNGRVLQYEDGLADYVRATTHGTIEGGSAQRDALLNRLEATR